MPYSFVPVPEWIMFNPDLTGADLRVFAALDRNVDRLGICSVDVAFLSWICSVCTKTVRRSLKRLEVEGAIIIEPMFDEGGRHISNRYWLAGDDTLLGVDLDDIR